jgi:hypothetical protein
MKKWLWIAALAILVALLLPIPQPPYDDGGTREYVALTYKIVDWNRIADDGMYEKLRIYPLFARNAAIDALWEEESASIPHHFVGRIVELDKFSALVEPMEWEWESRSSDRISVGLANLEDIDAVVNDLVEISYMGGIMESYPAQIHALSWKKAQELRQMNYPGTWLDPERSEEYGTASFEHIIITEIYADCFFASTVIPLPYLIKLNGQLGDDWCVGDQVSVTYENGRYDTETNHFEGDLKTIEVSTFRPDPFVAYKPVIYLYPEAETEVSVKLRVDGGLTCTYPAYGDGWRITAAPDGTLTDAAGQTYNYLYWEGETATAYDLSEGFCVAGADTAAFLEDALAQLGLTRREANEFIVYWLPQMEDNAYNLITFQQEAYTQAAKLTVTPAPNSVLRVFMTWKSLEQPVDIPAQTLPAFVRCGFTLIEWGGCQIQ